MHGRDRELRIIGAFATSLDQTTMVVTGLSGIGKSTAVLAALRRAGVHRSAVRVVRSSSARPYAQPLAGRHRLDLSDATVPADPGPGHELDPVALLEAVTRAEHVGDGPRVLFVDDVEQLSPGGTGWLDRLGDAAYQRDWRVVVATRQVTRARLADDVELLEVAPLDPRALRHVLDARLGRPVATDVAERLHRWSAGNPRIALELADGLSAAQQRGDVEWAGPRTVGLAARRAYRGLFEEARAADLARHPLLVLLREERPAASAGTTAEAVLDGLHLHDVPALSGAVEPRVAARAAGVTLLTGTTWTEGIGRWASAVPLEAWADHLWWREPADAEGTARAAGVRAARRLIGLEHTGRLADPAALRADLGLLGAGPDPHWLGLCLRVRAHLLLGDGPGAHRLLDSRAGPAEGRTVAEVVARDLATARVAVFDGRVADARDHLAHATDLRPGIQDWLPVEGLRAVTAAVLDGRPPPGEQPARPGAWSTRALGEFAVDVGTAHLATGDVEQAAGLLTIGLERCGWPYRGRAQARADLVEALTLHDPARGALPHQARGLVDPPVDPDERSDADTAAAHARMLALLAAAGGGASARRGVEEWLPAALSPVSPWQRLRSLIAYGRHHLAHGSRGVAEPALREARTLAHLAGLPGWGVAVDACLDRPEAPEERSWARLDDDERELVRLALGGTTNAQIARIAYVSLRTVANRFRQIYAVLHVHDRRGLTELARSHPPEWLARRA